MNIKTAPGNNTKKINLVLLKKIGHPIYNLHFGEKKLTYFLNHVREVSQSIILVLGTFLSLDEMMIRFCGQSAETNWMKNKPIKEGYNFFLLTTKHGFIVNFTPDGRKAATSNRQEYEQIQNMGKIESMVMFVLSVIKKKKDE